MTICRDLSRRPIQSGSNVCKLLELRKLQVVHKYLCIVTNQKELNGPELQELSPG